MSMPERSCIACRTKGIKNDFFRIVKTNTGEVVFDEKGTINGRGAYICKSEKCIDQICKKRMIDRTFKVQQSDDLYLRLKELI